MWEAFIEKELYFAQMNLWALILWRGKMPLYEFKCNRCESTFEKLILSSDEEDNVICPSCGEGDTCRLMSSFSCGSGKALSSGGSSACSPSPSGFSWAGWSSQPCAVTEMCSIRNLWEGPISWKGYRRRGNRWVYCGLFWSLAYGFCFRPISCRN